MKGYEKVDFEYRQSPGHEQNIFDFKVEDEWFNDNDKATDDGKTKKKVPKGNKIVPVIGKKKREGQ